MVEKKDCMSYIFEKVPELSKKWQEHLDFWGEDEPGLCNDLRPLTLLTIDSIEKRDTECLTRIFNTAEELLVIGDSDVKDVIATCFLESLVNISSAGTISSLSFVNLLGENSKIHCKKWDEFTGVKTVGL